MLVVKIELHSAITGKITEIGRANIINNGTGTHKRGNYDVEIMRRGTMDKVQRRGSVTDYPRLSYTVWELVRRALVAGLGKWPTHPGEPEEFDQDMKETPSNEIIDQAFSNIGYEQIRTLLNTEPDDNGQT
jgi:hypothetical protein